MTDKPLDKLHLPSLAGVTRRCVIVKAACRVTRTKANRFTR